MQAVHFNDLPRELMERCFSFLPPADIWKNARYVCPLWRAIIEQRRSGWVFEHGRDAIWIGVVKQTMPGTGVIDHDGFHGPTVCFQGRTHGTILPLPLHGMTTEAGETLAVFCHTYDDKRYYEYNLRLPCVRNPSPGGDGIPLLLFKYGQEYWTEKGRWFGSWKFRFERVAKGRVTLWLSCRVCVLALGAVSCAATDTRQQYALSSCPKVERQFFDSVAVVTPAITIPEME